MPAAYVIGLVGVVVVISATRVVVGGLPWRRATLRLSAADVVLVVLGLAGLALHCGAMFYRSAVESVPGTGAAIRQIAGLGVTSMLAFAVPSLLVIAGLRHIARPALAAILLSLAAVGTTMYDGGSLAAHLTAIFLSVAVLTLSAAALIATPTSPRA